MKEFWTNFSGAFWLLFIQYTQVMPLHAPSGVQGWGELSYQNDGAAVLVELVD